MAKAERTGKWLDVNAEMVKAAEIEALLEQSRKLNAELKALRKTIADRLDASVFSGTGPKAIVAIGYTRWGQLQACVDARPSQAAEAKPKRQTLADWLEMQA